MRIKKLELFGFKSFKDRTVIQFDPGITGIVGPNGCGKSNIVDALVWVMGEMSAKHLRGSNMSDVIFAGAEGFAPMGMSEVSLTLENDGGPFPAKYAKHSEVMVTRRLHRSGESEYLINKQPARLKDIQEIFMDTGAGAKGFSIIEQGAIGKIITSKPEDRRTLIEEAAGITKFKVRKKESQRKLQSTDQNLVRLQDIIGEQKRQLGSLERQAQRAERYRKLKQEIQAKELWVSSKRYLEMATELEEAENNYQQLQENEVGTNSNIGTLESELETLKLEVNEREQQVEEFQKQNKQAQDEVQALENEIRELRFEIEQARRDKEMTGSVVGQYQARFEALTKDLTQVSEQLKTAEEKEQTSTKEYEEIYEKFQGLQTQIDDVDQALTEKRREQMSCSQAESHLEAKIMTLESQLETANEQKQQSLEVLNELEEKKSEYETHRNKFYKKLENEKQLQLDIMRDVDNFEENLNLLKSQVEQKTSEIDTYKHQLNEVSGKLYGLENLAENFEGFQEGVKNIMLWQRQQKQMHPDGSESYEFKPVADVVEVPQEYELAMEAVLGQRLQLLLSNSSSESLSALDYLKSQGSGRSSFFAKEQADLTQHSQPENLKSEEGVDSFLADVVSVPEQYKQQVTYFLSDVVIVDSIRTALKLRPMYEGKTFVTRDGDTLTDEGVLTGGAKENVESGVLKRKREIKELSQKREEWAGKLSLAQASFEKVSAQAKTMEKELENAKKKHNEQELLVMGLKKDLERAENELQNVLKAYDKQKSESSRYEERALSLTDQMQELQDRITEVKEQKFDLEQEVERLTEELKNSRTGFGSLQDKVTSLKVEAASNTQIAEGLRSQSRMLENSIKETEEQLSKMNEETQKSSESLSTNSVLIEEKQVELEKKIFNAKQAAEILESANDEYEKAWTRSRDLEAQVSQANKSLNEYKNQLNSAQLKLEQLRMKELYLLEQIQERYMVDLREHAKAYLDGDHEFEGQDAESIEKDVESLKSKISRIGDVNLSAIDEYDELKERYEFLSKQHEDLIEAKDQLRKVIDRINRICTRRFKETFDQVNERFEKVFPVLFGGGEAKLMLVENPDKPDAEVGIDIIAKPPGKRPQSVSLLSGGEKALTAVSLIFSIFLVKPSPFCLLDEVDAPLDDANVIRFNDLVKEMAKRSQIIIVTHNKHTMKVNNKLYGVTQEHKGVSKMVSVDLQKAAQLAEQ